MAEYGKKKNDELAALCKERGLAHTGKKADLVKRLEDHDASGSAAPAPTETAKPAAAEDEIDWDDEPATEVAKHATTEASAAAIAAGGIGQVPNPQAVPNQQVGEDVTKTDEATADATSAPVVEGEAAKEADTSVVEKQKTPEDFTAGLAERTLEEEIEKRKKRAEKFGKDPNDDETLKMMERAKRFGTTDLPGMLNKALPERQEREKKRGREGGHDGGVRKRSRGRPGMGRRQDSGKNEKRSERPANGNGGNWMTEKDRAAAEKRKARFAGQSAE